MKLKSKDTCTQTDEAWVSFSDSVSNKNQSRYEFARKNDPCRQARASNDLVQGILSTVGKRVTWMDTSFGNGDAGDMIDSGKNSPDSWDGSFSSGESRECSTDHQEAPSILWLKQYERREIGHCFEEYGKGIIDGQRMREVLIQRFRSVQTTCHHCQKVDLLQQTIEAIEVLQHVTSKFLLRASRVEGSSHSLRLLTPCLNTTVAEVISSRQNLREGMEEHARFMAACLVEGAMYLHAHNVVHRDITPDNVHLDNRGYIKLTNFHHAIHAVPGQYVQGECGSLGYQAPEVVSGLGHMHTVDYWGIGCVIYEFLFGFTPFADEDEGRLRSKTVLNPEFAITRLGNRFRHMSFNGQDAIKSFMCKYPHKRMGYKSQEGSKMKWFQSYKWSTISNQSVPSPLVMFLKDANFDSDVNSPNSKKPNGHVYDGIYSQNYAQGKYGPVGQKPSVKGSSSCNWTANDSPKPIKKTYSTSALKSQRSPSKPQCIQWVDDIVQNVPGLRKSGGCIYESGDGANVVPNDHRKKFQSDDRKESKTGCVSSSAEFHSTPISNVIGDYETRLMLSPAVSPVLPTSMYNIWKHDIEDAGSPDPTSLSLSLEKGKDIQNKLTQANANPSKSQEKVKCHARRQIASAGLLNGSNCLFTSNGIPAIAKRPKTSTGTRNLAHEFHDLKFDVYRKQPHGQPIYSTCGGYALAKEVMKSAITPPQNAYNSSGRYHHVATPAVKKHIKPFVPIAGQHLIVSACSVVQSDRPVNVERVVKISNQSDTFQKSNAHTPASHGSNHSHHQQSHKMTQSHQSPQKQPHHVHTVSMYAVKNDNKKNNFKNTKNSSNAKGGKIQMFQLMPNVKNNEMKVVQGKKMLM